ncbi:MAG: endonuclease III [Bacteroidota bacterium]
MTKKERYKHVIEYFEQNVLDAETELHYKNPYELAVAVILSAQCTDKRVNMITPGFFKQYPEPSGLANANLEDVFKIIKSCSYPNNKARHLIGMAKKICQDFHGEIPRNIEELLTIPGIGRKTANVIAAVAFKIPAMPVDTHVFRVTERIGLSVNSKNPLETEKQLVKNIPAEKLVKAHHWLILHGRYTCLARKPKCKDCGLKLYCKFYEGNKKNIKP